MTKPTLGNPQNTIEILQNMIFHFRKSLDRIFDRHTCVG